MLHRFAPPRSRPSPGRPLFAPLVLVVDRDPGPGGLTAELEARGYDVLQTTSAYAALSLRGIRALDAVIFAGGFDAAERNALADALAQARPDLALVRVGGEEGPDADGAQVSTAADAGAVDRMLRVSLPRDSAAA
jgi:hypothetical protein